MANTLEYLKDWKYTGSKSIKIQVNNIKYKYPDSSDENKEKCIIMLIVGQELIRHGDEFEEIKVLSFIYDPYSAS